MADNYTIERIANGWTIKTAFPSIDPSPMPPTYAATLGQIADLMLVHEHGKENLWSKAARSAP